MKEKKTDLAIDTNKKTSFFKKANGTQKLVFCSLLAFGLFAFLLAIKFQILTALMLSWDCFSLSMILISSMIFFTTNAEELSRLAKEQDESLAVIFSIVLISVCFSLFGTLFLLFSKDDNLVSREMHTFVSILGVAMSWPLLHTIFTFRYAHLYYDYNKEKTTHKGGLEFPSEEYPDYLDFAYFSFIIGMTFQVSDVNVRSRKIRRLALLHGLISFIFNTIIVGLAITTFVNIKP
jgi:uncharacterized membrane protein